MLSGFILKIAAQLSLPGDKLDVEDKGSIGRDHTWNTAGAISVVGGASEGGLLSLGELADAFVPAADDLADTNGELEGLSTFDARIEDLAVGKATSVVDLNSGTLGADGTIIRGVLLNFEGGRSAHI